MEKWVIQAKRADFAAIGKQYGIDQVLARVLINRGIKEDAIDDYLHPSLSYLGNPNSMYGIKEAVDLLCHAIFRNQHIRVIGDYDVDGINATYILKSGIAHVGGLVDYSIPRRIEDGYGVNVAMMDKAQEDGIDLVITCDNGIAATEAVAHAKELGLQVIVTDHHAIPYKEADGVRSEILPEADVIVNPHQRACSYLYPNICGATVAWKVVTALFQAYQLSSSEAMVYLENVAFATICDVMPLCGENRNIVYFGLKAMSNSQNTGLRALLGRNNLLGTKLTVYHLGFVLGPCFNATGRLDTAARALELLDETDENQAIVKASELISLNDERKAMTIKGYEATLQIIQEEHLTDDDVLVIYLAGLHESLAGIVAGRIKEKFYRPTIVLTDGSDSDEIKGSGRSISGYSMYDKLHECDDLLLKYGGHPMAAGLTLKRENLLLLRQRLNEHSQLTQELLEKKILIDVPMPLTYLNMKLVEDLSLLEPFGTGNEKPLFADRNLNILRVTYLGAQKNFLKLLIWLPNQLPIEALYFGDAVVFEEYYVSKFKKEEWEKAVSGQQNLLKMDLVYEPQVNEFRGSKKLQIIISSYR